MAEPSLPPIEGTIHETLGIRARGTSPDLVVLEMPVGPQVHQPFGVLHGGASAVMAESAASMGAYLNCTDDEYAVGIEFNISHLRARRSGTVRATAYPIRKGRSVHVWGIDIQDQEGGGVAVARCTLAIRPTERKDA